MNAAEYETAVAAALEAKKMGQQKGKGRRSSKKSATTSKKFSIVSVGGPLAAIRRRRADKAQQARETISNDGDLMSFDAVKPKKLTRKQRREAKKEQTRLNARATPVGAFRTRGVTLKNTGDGLRMVRTPWKGADGTANTNDTTPTTQEHHMPLQKISSQEIDTETQSQMNFWANLSAPAQTAPVQIAQNSPSLFSPRTKSDPFADIARRESKSPVCSASSSRGQLDMFSGEWTWVSPVKADKLALPNGGSFLDLKLDMSPGEGTPTQVMKEITNTSANTLQNPFDQFEVVSKPVDHSLYASTIC